MPKVTICQRPACVQDASHELTAQGTAPGYQVCYDDQGWAKQQLVEDFPGRRVERAVIAADNELVDVGESVVTYVGDPAVFGVDADDSDGW